MAKKSYKKIFLDNDFVFYSYTFLLSLIGAIYFRFVLLTSKITYDINIVDKTILKQENFILGFWHGRLLAPLIVRKYFGKARVLISHSKSAYLIKLICKYFGVDKVEGSSGKGGFAGVRESLRLFKNKPLALAIAPDGSIGPRMQCSEGIVALAQITKTPILLLSFSSSKAKIMNSWDRFFLPLPFGKITVHVSEIFNYKDEEGNNKDPETFRLFIESYLNNKTWELDKKYKQPHIDVAEYGRKGVVVKTRNKNQKS
ncbi:MAG: DUF374 domain-containing protein [Alphaproteobacteria bacterium]|jgi:lysophospholipid acyltransferase (LPLAT)-like uncharacterized protein|nr:DUF374 domain-containing protein [Alphaproteobacteria bacterium]